MTPINAIPQSTAVVSSSAARPPNEGLKNLPGSSLEGQKMPPVEQQRETLPVTSEALKQTVKKLNEFATSYQRSLNFSVDEASNRTVIRVINTDTDEVVRQIPTEEVLSLARNLESQMSAILSVLA